MEDRTQNGMETGRTYRVYRCICFIGFVDVERSKGSLEQGV